MLSYNQPCLQLQKKNIKNQDSQTCSDINEANETPETIHKKENDQEVDPMIPSEELHDQSHTIVIETKLEVDVAISGVEKVDAA